MSQLFLLFKFGKKEHLEKLQAGKIRYMSAEKYNSFEENQGDTSIGDKYDSKDVTVGAKCFLYTEDGQFMIRGTNPVTVFASKQLSKCPIFCCAVISAEDLPKVIEEETKVIFEGNCEELFKDFWGKEYWTHCLIINGNRFVEQFKNACDQQKIICDYGPVKYYNPERTPKEKQNEIDKDFSKISFWKVKDKYEGQHEYRLLLKNKCIENKEIPYVQEIGDISEFSNLVSVDKLKQDILRFEYDK